VQVVILIVDAIFALVKSIVGWLIALTGKGSRDFFARVAGTKTWLLVDSGTKKKSMLCAFWRKHVLALLIAVNVVAAIVVGLVFDHIQGEEHPVAIMPAPGSSATSQPSTPAPSPTPLYDLSPVITTTHWVSWAILDTKRGIFAGSANWDQPSYFMSMIKPWIAADYFNEQPSRPTSATLSQLASMIVDSNDQVAYQYFGGQPSLDRLVHTCGITDIVYRSWSWSLTEISARDAVRYGECIYSGKATSPEWTAWIVDKMRHVRGDGDFGPRELFPDRAMVATKNGWYFWEGKWYVNCLAVTDDWVISIIQEWPYAGGDLLYGIGLANPICKSVADQVLRLSA
jgi:hypothetical protein